MNQKIPGVKSQWPVTKTDWIFVSLNWVKPHVTRESSVNMVYPLSHSNTVTGRVLWCSSPRVLKWSSFYSIGTGPGSVFHQFRYVQRYWDALECLMFSSKIGRKKKKAQLKILNYFPLANWAFPIKTKYSNHQLDF